MTDTGATQANVSNHLRVLRRAGMIVLEPRGRYTYYRLVPETLEGAARQLTDLAARARATAATSRPC
ncbi:helix-turn-helix domain-containing protein [Luedemannella flava]|uniref:ArsR/SmtB family transcription factor n=1 Tax=Luedemannella flava TaxID=349316 RepID=UPI0031D1B00F